MKKSEIRLTGDSYRTTPTSWGDTCIMVNEDMAVESMRESGFEVESPDGDENDRPLEVEIAVDEDGIFYAIQPAWEETSWGRRTGVINPELFIRCENPADTIDGMIGTYGSWHEFDGEEDEAW